MKETRYLAYKTGIICVVKGDDGFFRDAYGGIYALADDSKSVDKVARCGIGIVSLPSIHPLTDACRVHDYQYQSPTYQAFHSRKEADKYLRCLAMGMGYPLMGNIFYRLTRWFGKPFWEGKKFR